MNSIQLEYFLNVAKAGSFTLAAKKLFISQPALSKQIKLLEEELGCILMLRSADGIHLTPEGKKLLQRAEDITGKIKSIPQEMNQLHHTVAGELNIVCGTLLTRKIMPGLLKRLLQKYPEICPRIRENPVREHADLLKNSSADIGIGNIHNSDKHLAIHPLFSSDLVLIRSVNSALADKKKVSRQDIAAHKMIAYPQGSFLHESIKKILHPYQPNILMDSQSSATIIELVRENFGLAFVPDYLIDPERRAGIIIGGFNSGVRINIGYYYCPERPLSPQAKAFIDVIHETFGLDPL